MKTVSKFKVCTLIGLLGLSSCSEQSDYTDKNELTPQVLLTSINVQLPRAASEENAPEGGYYFGWSNTNGQANYTPVRVEKGGTIENSGKINAYWDNINRKKELTFSNSLDIKEEDNKQDTIDILWGKTTVSSENNISFTLQHKMAKAQIDLTIPETWTVKSIRLTELKRQYTFSNSNGNVIANGDNGVIKIDKFTTSTTTSTTGATLLPPQDKGENSELEVIINDGSNERIFHRKLPTAMAEDIGEGKWQDILLRFRAGYMLRLEATVTDNSDNEIHFTYATLEKWVDKGNGTISARPAGIYTIADWNAFATAYNTTPKDEIRLKKYGSETNGVWEFTLQRALDFSKASGKVVPAHLIGSDKLKAKNGKCTITGKTANELGVEDHADNVTFK